MFIFPCKETALNKTVNNNSDIVKITHGESILVTMVMFTIEGLEEEEDSVVSLSSSFLLSLPSSLDQ